MSSSIGLDPWNIRRQKPQSSSLDRPLSYRIHPWQPHRSCLLLNQQSSQCPQIRSSCPIATCYPTLLLLPKGWAEPLWLVALVCVMKCCESQCSPPPSLCKYCHFIQGNVHPRSGPAIWLIYIGRDCWRAVNIHYLPFVVVDFPVLLAIPPFLDFVAFLLKPTNSSVHPSPWGHCIEYLTPKQDMSLRRFFSRED